MAGSRRSPRMNSASPPSRAMLRSSPVERLSTTRTRCPSWRRRSATCDPMKPAASVTRHCCELTPHPPRLVDHDVRAAAGLQGPASETGRHQDAPDDHRKSRCEDAARYREVAVNDDLE